MEFKELTTNQKDKFARMVVEEMDMECLVNTAVDRVLDNWAEDTNLFDEDNEVYKFDKVTD